MISTGNQQGCKNNTRSSELFFQKASENLFVEAVLQFSLHRLQCSIAAVTLSFCTRLCAVGWDTVSVFLLSLTQQASKFRWQHWLWWWKQWWSCSGLSSASPLHLLLCLLVLSHVHFLSCLYHPVCCPYSFCLKWQGTEKIINVYILQNEMLQISYHHLVFCGEIIVFSCQN